MTTSSAVRCSRVLLLLLPFAEPAFGDAVSVDVTEWCASTNTVLPSGWMAEGIVAYSDRGVRFPKMSDFALSPIYPCAITQVVMNVKSSNPNVQSFLTMTPVVPDLPAEKRQARPTDNKYEIQAFAWERATDVRQIRFQKEGNYTASWGIAELTIYLDRIDAPTGLAVEQKFCDAFGARWCPAVTAVRHEVEVRKVEPPKFSLLAEWDFTSLTNTVNATKDLDAIPHGDLGEFDGVNLCLAAYQGGHLQIGKSDKAGILSLPLPEGVNRTCLTELFSASASEAGGDVYVYSVDGASVTNTLAMPVLEFEKMAFDLAIPDDAVELQFVSRSKRRIRITGARVVSDYVPSALSPDPPVVARSRSNACLVRHLNPGEWEWRVRSFDRDGVPSPWSAAMRVKLDAGDPPRVKPGFMMSLR